MRDEDGYSTLQLFNIWFSIKQSIPAPDCGLARGNPQWLGVLYLFSKPRIYQFNFLVDLKAQSPTQPQKDLTQQIRGVPFNNFLNH